MYSAQLNTRLKKANNGHNSRQQNTSHILLSWELNRISSVWYRSFAVITGHQISPLWKLSNWMVLDLSDPFIFSHTCGSRLLLRHYCPACRTYLIATRFWVVVICPIIKCLTVLEFSFILFDLCLFITIFNYILNYVPIVTFWIFTYHTIWILLIIFCFIWNYWIIYFLTCLEVFWSVVS